MVIKSLCTGALAFSISACASADLRSYQSAKELYLDNKRGTEQTASIKSHLNLYDTTLSLIDGESRDDKLLYLGAEIDDDELFMFEIRESSGAMNIIKKSYEINLDKLIVELDGESMLFENLLKHPIGHGNLKIYVGDTLINSFNDSDKSRNVAYELQATLFEKDAPRYSSITDKVRANTHAKMISQQKIDSSNNESETATKGFETKTSADHPYHGVSSKKNRNTTSQEKMNKDSCTFYKANREQPVKSNYFDDSNTIHNVKNNEILQKFDSKHNEKNKWSQVLTPDNQIGWVWLGKKSFNIYSGECKLKIN